MGLTLKSTFHSHFLDLCSQLFVQKAYDYDGEYNSENARKQRHCCDSDVNYEKVCQNNKYSVQKFHSFSLLKIQYVEVLYFIRRVVFYARKGKALVGLILS